MRLFIKTVLAALLAAVLLCGCEGGILPQETTEPPVLRIAQVVTEQSLLELEQLYPQLQEADFTGSECYDAIESYIGRNPQVKVRYAVRLGNTAAAPDAEALTLKPADFDFGILRENLQYLHRLKTVFFQDTTLTMDTIQALRSQYPELGIGYSVNLLGKTYDATTKELDLSETDPETVLNQGALLGMLPELTDIQLMKADETTAYDLSQAAALQAQVPQALLHYTFNLFDKTVSTTDEEVIYTNKKIGNKEGALDELRTALSIMRGCKRFVLDNCRFGNEDLAAVRDEFRDTTKVVWRVWFGKGGCLTDRKVIRHVYNLYDSTSANLVYCEDAEFVDFGHNDVLKNCDFIAGMPHLKAVILSGSMISDLTPFAACQELEFLEIAYCGYISDISPLASCSNLKRLNIAYTKVEDLSALDGLGMEVLVDARSKTDADDWTQFAQLHPGCVTQHTGDVKDDQPYGCPWRYDENGDPNEYYALLKEEFNYPKPTDTLY